MKVADIKNLSSKELQEKLVAEEARLNRMRLDHAITPLQNSSQIRTLRRDIARMKTILSQNESNAK
ncbi:MAG: 50S ribosomal protein L29 [Paludibacteraceae bacterium]|nr:50S ribosomal protein L29 [Paludibacteraceae bacterium]